MLAASDGCPTSSIQVIKEPFINKVKIQNKIIIKDKTRLKGGIYMGHHHGHQHHGHTHGHSHGTSSF